MPALGRTATRTTSLVFHTLRRSASTWANVPMGPPDPILGVTEAFKADKNPNKINLGVGAYRDDAGKPFVLSCVKKAEKTIYESKQDKEYLPITGLADFVKLGTQLAYGNDAHVIKDNLLAATQSLSGTGGLRIGGAFLARFYPTKKIYLPTPTWGNHGPIFRDSGLEVSSYRYFDKNTNGLDFQGMCEDLKNMPNSSIVLLHACAHNPTGVDPTPEQWKQIGEICKAKNHFAFFDMAYQGFASGSPTRDATSLRTFLSLNHPNLALSQSFAKNMGLYGERAGIFSIQTTSPEEQKRVESQIKILVRPMYSSPPLSGARIVKEILSREELTREWEHEVQGMATRIISMRNKLRTHLEKTHKSSKPWNHITDQIGMFCYSGLNPDQVDRLKKEFSVYLTRDGRISVAGITSGNVEYLANAIHQVTK